MKSLTIAKTLYYFFTFLLILSAWALIYNIRIAPNIFQLDMWWQIASAEFFSKYGFHSYNPDRFGGFINNLFYPPLQDILLWIIKNISWLQMLSAFQIYLTLLIISYITGFILISTRFTSRSAKALYSIFIIWYLHLDKQFLTHFQWLGFIDIAFTGLISEILGWVFLNFLIYEILWNNQRYIRQLVYAIFAFLSHLVVGPFAFVLIGFMRLTHWKKEYFLNCILWIWITAFFWVPFASFGDYMTSDSIVLGFPYLLTLGFIIVIRYFTHKTEKTWLAIALSWAAVLLPSELFFLFDFTISSFHDFFPKFHYSRLVVLSLFVLILSASKIIDIIATQYNQNNENEPKTNKRNLIFICLFLYITFIKTFDFIYIPDIFQNMVGYTDRTWYNLDLIKKVNDNKRIFVIDAKRPVDFNIDSFFQYQWYSWLHFVKWLFRESNRANNVLTSYLATILRNSDLVVWYNYFFNLSCEHYKLFVDHFASDYGIGWIISADLFTNNQYLDEMKKRCYDWMFRDGTANFSYEFAGDFGINNVTYHMFKISKREDWKLDNNLAELVDPKSKLIELDSASNDFYYDKITLHKRDIVEQQVLSGKQAEFIKDMFIVQQDYEKNKLWTGIFNNLKQQSWFISDIRYNKNDLHFTIDSKERVLVQVKSTYYPGLEVFENGEKITVYPLYHGFVIHASGTIEIKYKKPLLFKLAYGISILFIIIFLIQSKKRSH